MYISEHGLLPLSKLIVRVFENAVHGRAYRQMGSVKRGDDRISYKNDFMLQFTESSPMFEYVDAGSGKERVDGKIQGESFLVHVSTKTRGGLLWAFAK